MKRILIVSSVASMIDQFIMSNVELLKNQNVEVHIATNFIKGNTCTEERIVSLKERLVQMNVLFYQVDFDRNVFNFSSNFQAILQLLKITKKIKFDYIHAHSPIGGVCARIIGTLSKNKVIYTAHGFHFFKGAPKKNWLIYYPIEKILAKYTDTLITINLEDYYFAKRKLNPNKVKYIPGVGVNINSHHNFNENIKMKIRKELGIPVDSKVMLSVGELNDNKNHEYIIDIMSNNIIDKNIIYVICGQGEMFDYYNEKIKKLNLTNKVFLLGFREDVKEMYLMADLFVFPSKREGLPVSIMEAMSNKLPVLCSNIRGNIDLIDENKGGIYINLYNQSETLFKINHLLKDEEILNKFGNYNFKKVMKFNVENVNKELLNVYGIKNRNSLGKVGNI
ncbi:glycosyltransferase [Exiguobacterium sp. PHA03]|uniref:glycosyltransferase n=1 Tax=Exiguobacterium sp. PHA03 TaxID=3064895 RepID=UPI0035C07770